MSIKENIERINAANAANAESKETLRVAINAKGGGLGEDAKLADFAAGVENIKVPDFSLVTAESPDVRAGKRFFSASGTLIGGVMPDATISYEDSKITVTAGYLDSDKEFATAMDPSAVSAFPDRVIEGYTAYMRESEAENAPMILGTGTIPGKHPIEAAYPYYSIKISGASVEPKDPAKPSEGDTMFPSINGTYRISAEKLTYYTDEDGVDHVEIPSSGTTPINSGGVWTDAWGTLNRIVSWITWGGGSARASVTWETASSEYPDSWTPSQTMYFDGSVYSDGYFTFNLDESPSSPSGAYTNPTSEIVSGVHRYQYLTGEAGVTVSGGTVTVHNGWHSVDKIITFDAVKYPYLQVIAESNASIPGLYQSSNDGDLLNYQWTAMHADINLKRVNFGKKLFWVFASSAIGDTLTADPTAQAVDGIYAAAFCIEVSEDITDYASVIAPSFTEVTKWVDANLEEVTITFVPAGSRGYDTSDATATADDVKNGKIFYNANGRVVGDYSPPVPEIYSYGVLVEADDGTLQFQQISFQGNVTSKFGPPEDFSTVGIIAMPPEDDDPGDENPGDENPGDENPGDDDIGDGHTPLSIYGPAGSSICLTAVGGLASILDSSNLQFRKGATGNWYKLGLDSYISLSETEPVQFYNKSRNFSDSEAAYYKFVVDTSNVADDKKYIDASGELASLVNYSNGGHHDFYRLFSGCPLRTPPSLNGISGSAYTFAYTFAGTKLTSLPELSFPIGNYCYLGTFSDIQPYGTVFDYNSPHLTTRRSMSITLPDHNKQTGAYERMFYSCQCMVLNINAEFTTWDDGKYTKDWLSLTRPNGDASSSGTFAKYSVLNKRYGDSYINKYMTVVNK